MKCKHLTTTEAWRSASGAEGTWEAVAAVLCAWPCNTPHLALAPAWIGRTIGGGYPVNPKVDCAACPAFEKQAAV